MNLRCVVRAVAFAGMALILSHAHGQVPGGGGTFPGGGGRGGMGAGSAGRASGSDAHAGSPMRTMDPAEQLSIQLGELEEDLKLAPGQGKAWETYSDRLRRLADDIARNRATLRFATGSAPQQLDLLADSARNRLTAFEDVAEAGKSLYAALTPSQREIADRRLARVAFLLVDLAQPVGMASGGRGARGEPGVGR